MCHLESHIFPGKERFIAVAKLGYFLQKCNLFNRAVFASVFMDNIFSLCVYVCLFLVCVRMFHSYIHSVKVLISHLEVLLF